MHTIHPPTKPNTQAHSHTQARQPSKILVIALLLCMLALCAWAKSIPVESALVRYGTLSKVETFIGSVRFKEVSSIATSAQGIVQEMYFSTGDNVKKGQKLLALDSALLLEDIKIKQAKIDDARYTLQRQKNELERYENLLESQSISIQQYENLEYEIKSQEARIQALLAELAISQVQQKQKIIYAPFDGMIVEQRVHVGEWVQTGAAICQILNSKDTEVIIDVPSSVIRALRPKQSVSLAIGGKNYRGKIAALIPRADTLSRTFPVHIAVRNDGSFLDGMAARVLLDISGDQKGYIIPRGSIAYRDGKPYVFAIRSLKAVQIPVEILSTQDSQMLVRAKLTESDSLVLRGQENLQNGAQVHIIKSK